MRLCICTKASESSAFKAYRRTCDIVANGSDNFDFSETRMLGEIFVVSFLCCTAAAKPAMAFELEAVGSMLNEGVLRGS